MEKETKRTRSARHKKSKFKKFTKIIKIAFLFFTMITVLAVVYLAFKLYPEYQAMSLKADKLIEEMDERTFVRLEPTRIVRKDGEIVKEFNQADYEYIEIGEVPQVVKDAFISIEDKNFYNHKGFDLKANIRALRALIQNDGRITQGGSTITQQLVKNTFLSHEQTYERKVQEILIATRLESELKKDKILEYYINNIYYANGVYGIATASNYYYDKNIDELSLSEVATLVAIPNSPNRYNPIENPDNNKARRDRIINHMYEDGKIGQEEMIQAKSQEVVLNLKDKEEYVPDDFEVSYVLSNATKSIMESEGFDLKFRFESNEDREEYNNLFQEVFEETYERIRAGGYVIESTIDPIKQEQLQSAINEGLSSLSTIDEETGLYKTQGAGVTIDNESREVVAIVGGRTQENIHNSFNRAYLSYRQPGSVIKPIVSYGVEFDNDMLSFHEVVDEKDEDGPANVDNVYRGAMTVREALERSVNTVPFQLIKDRGAGRALEYMESMEFSNIVDEDNNAGIGIGGFTYGATPLEIAGAFGTLANNGSYVRPFSVKRIEFDGSLVYEHQEVSTKVYNDSSAFIMTDILKGVLESDLGTGKGLMLDNMPAAAKTGTSDDNKDGWLAGYTPYYTTAIWVGNDLPKKVDGLYGSTYPGRIWKSYMDKIHESLEFKDFTVPPGVEKMYLNLETGFVSRVPKDGYTLHEFLPASYIEKAEGERMRQEEIEREKEQEKLVAEAIMQQEFENKYNITMEEEMTNRALVEKRIEQALLINIRTEDDYNGAVSLLDEAIEFLDRVKVESFKRDYMNAITEAYSKIEKEKDVIVEKNRIKEEKEQERLEQERIEKEEQEKLEQERLEQERLEQEELEKERDEDESEKEDPESEDENGEQESEDVNDI